MNLLFYNGFNKTIKLKDSRRIFYKIIFNNMFNNSSYIICKLTFKNK